MWKEHDALKIIQRNASYNTGSNQEEPMQRETKKKMNVTFEHRNKGSDVKIFEILTKMYIDVEERCMILRREQDGSKGTKYVK